MEQILILGGTGFIGKNLSRALIDQGYQVVVYSEWLESNQMNDHYQTLIHYYTGRLNEIEKLERLFNDYQFKSVIHLVSSLSPASTQDNYVNELNDVFIPTQQLLSLMKKHHILQFLFFSSGGTVYGNYKTIGLYTEEDALKPINYYGLSKVHMESMIQFECHKLDIHCTIIRPSNPFGRYQNIHAKQGLIPVVIGKALQNEVIEIWGDGEVVRDYLPIHTLVNAVIELMKLNLKFEVVNVGSGVGTSVNQVLSMISAVFPTPLTIQYLAGRSIDSKAVVLNTEKLNSLIHLPSFDLQEEIRRFYTYLLEQHHE